MPELRIDSDLAQRLIAQRLRESKMLPDEANKLASHICAGLLASTATATRPGLKRWRIIPASPDYDAMSAIGGLIRSRHPEIEPRDGWEKTTLLIDLWSAVWQQGREPPDDVVW